MSFQHGSPVRRSLLPIIWLLPVLCHLPLGAQALQRKVPIPAPAAARPDSPVSVLPARPTDRAPLPSIGSISGTVSWRASVKTQNAFMKGVDSSPSMLSLHAWIDTATHETYASQLPPPSRRKMVGTAPKYGPVTTEGQVAFVTYTISGLPQGVKIWVVSERPQNTYQTSQPYGVKCSMASGLEVKNYNLQFEFGPGINIPSFPPRAPR